MKARRTGGKGGATAPIGDGSGEWSAGLRHDGQAALVGTILAAMPHLDELVADLAADRLGGDARTVLAALDRDDAARLAFLESLERGKDGLAAAIASYAAARRLWRAYGGGLWYTHASGRTYLAAPDGGAAFRVAREVKPADLRRAKDEVDRLAAALAALVDAPRKPRSRVKPGTKPEALPEPRPAPVSAAPAAKPATETARAKRAAPMRTAGARRRPAPQRPAKAVPPPAGEESVPSPAE